MLFFLIIAVMVECSSMPEAWKARGLSCRLLEVYIPSEKTDHLTGNYNSVVWDIREIADLNIEVRKGFFREVVSKLSPRLREWEGEREAF